MNIIESKQSELENKLVEFISTDFNNFMKDEKSDFYYLALPGGNSIKKILNLLSVAGIDWSRVKILLTDEREVSEHEQESNIKLIKDLLISKIDIPEDNLILPTLGFEPEHIDFIILSAGEDGHIASLFPNHESILDETLGYIKVSNSPKLPSDRISLSKNTILKAKNVALLFFGPQKYDAFQDFNNPLLSEKECPAKLLEDIENLYVLVDVVK